ncbi:MAG: GNAT family N-acetyltransferase [Candidatus Kariarchaeaceae archaeon]|jgi:predicted GNAT superfamily acetyltransferase
MDEIHGIVNVQKNAWDMADLEVVATFEMKAVSSFGTVLIAVDSKDKVIGFIYGFPYFPDKHYSHMMATLPEWQGKGVGFAMKKVHREIALQSETQINSIVWTVDPLLTNNSYLNFAKLGGVCSTYYPNYYGDPEEVGIYKGIPTDRFLLEWHIRTDKVQRRMNNYKLDRIDRETLLERSPVINKIVDDRFQALDDSVFANSFSVEVPGDYQDLKNKSLEIAIDWRMEFRRICQDNFDTGYEIIDFHTFQTDDNRRNYYEFAKKS